MTGLFAWEYNEYLLRCDCKMLLICIKERLLKSKNKTMPLPTRVKGLSYPPYAPHKEPGAHHPLHISDNKEVKATKASQSSGCAG